MNPLATHTIKIDDIQMYFEIYAKNDLENKFHEDFVDGKFIKSCDNVVVMLHGNGEDRSIFYNNVEAVCCDNYCILVDSRAHGKSTAGSEELTIDLMSEDISKLCDLLNIGKFMLVGFSDGGNVAITYAIRHPERLSHLVVAGANINPSGLKMTTRLSIFTKYLLSKPSQNKNNEAKRKFMLLNLMVNHPHISPRLLKNIVCKTLVIEGKRDVIKPSHTKLISDLIPNSKHVTIPDSGHNVFCDNVAFTNKTIVDFFS